MNNVFSQWFHYFRGKFALPVDGASLGLFRIAWGGLMVVDGFRKLPKASGLYSVDYFHFKYALTPFVEPLPENWMVTVEIWVLIFSAAMVMIGFGFRYFNVVFTLLYTHFFLIEKMYYNNHFYLTCLLAFLLTFTAADRCFSVASWRRRRRGDIDSTTPFWNLIILRTQVIILYFYGGIAKIQGDWLQGEPLRHWFGNKPEEQIKAPLIWFPEIIKQEWFVWTLSYGGMIFDLVIGFLLLNRKTFWPACVAVIFFHTTNHSLFKIGLFPYIGVSFLILFFQPHWPRPLFRKSSPFEMASPSPAPLLSKGFTIFLLVFVAIQLLLPFRSLRYKDDPSWSEVGHYFSWRMMLRDKDAYVKFFFNPPEAEKLLEATKNKPRIGKSHISRMVKNPHMILQYAHALDQTFQSMGINGVEIRAAAIVSLNGRPYQAIIDPSRDLTDVSYGFFNIPDWIIPLEKSQRPGLYPKTQDARKAAIKKAFDRDVLPALKQVKRKKFKKPFAELLEAASPEIAAKYRAKKAEFEKKKAEKIVLQKAQGEKTALDKLAAEKAAIEKAKANKELRALIEAEKSTVRFKDSKTVKEATPQKESTPE